MEKGIVVNPMPEILAQYRDAYPYMYKYASLHYPFKPLPEYLVPFQYKDREAVYKAALDKGVTWEELLNFSGYEGGVEI